MLACILHSYDVDVYSALSPPPPRLFVSNAVPFHAVLLQVPAAEPHEGGLKRSGWVGLLAHFLGQKSHAFLGISGHRGSFLWSRRLKVKGRHVAEPLALDLEREGAGRGSWGYPFGYSASHYLLRVCGMFAVEVYARLHGAGGDFGSCSTE